VADCDGYHGVSRSSIPASLLKAYEKSYPFGWLGIMSETPPFPEICYCYHRRGFALASMRTPMLSRYYIQCDLGAKPQDWPDERFWGECKARCPPDGAEVRYAHLRRLPYAPANLHVDARPGGDQANLPPHGHLFARNDAASSATACCRARTPKGEGPAELSVQAPKPKLVVSLKAAKALGLIVPPSLLASADEVTE
jgi:FAD binding domain